MALFVKQDEKRSELQQKIAADIAERQRARAINDQTPPDGVNDSRLIEGTSHMSWVGFVILGVLIIAVVIIVVVVSSH